MIKAPNPLTRVTRSNSCTNQLTQRAPISLDQIVINRQLLTRPIAKLNRRGEIAAMYALASVMMEDSSTVLKRLATLSIELCCAGTGGVSVVETGDDGVEIFRWRALAGEFERYVGGTTPRDWSPCGECLKARKPMLYSYPARFFTYFQKIDTPIVEGLVIPMFVNAIGVGTIWIVSHSAQRKFDAEDVRIMTSLADFAGSALSPASLHDSPGGEHTGDRTALRPGVEREIVWAEYVRRIALGDNWALDQFCHETKSLVFAIALRILSFRADAEEVAADVYTQVWKTAATYNVRRGGVGCWLFSMARTRAIDLLRSRAARLRSEAGLYLECSSAINPEKRAVASQTRRHIHQAVHALPALQRRAIELAYFSGLPMSAIAEQLGAPVGTIKTRVRTGLLKLRRSLASVA